MLQAVIKTSRCLHHLCTESYLRGGRSSRRLAELWDGAPSPVFRRLLRRLSLSLQKYHHHRVELPGSTAPQKAPINICRNLPGPAARSSITTTTDGWISIW